MSTNEFNPETSEAVVCTNINQDKIEGLFFTDDHFSYMTRMFPFQVSMLALVSSVLHLFLKPLGETPVVAQMLAGILLGPSWLGNYKMVFNTVFAGGDSYLVETLGLFGCMIHFFLVGLKMDLSILGRSTKKERLIGISTFIMPFIFTVPVSFFLMKYTKRDKVKKSLPLIAIMESTTSFHVISCFLADLRILNTELGRLASSASTISGMCGWITIITTFSWKQHSETPYPHAWIWYLLTLFGEIIFITFVIRSAVIWIIKKTPRGEFVKEIYLLAILLAMLLSGCMGEVFGQHYLFGPMILGLAIPGGPPVGSALVEKLESLISGLLVPLFFCYVGGLVNLKKPDETSFLIISTLSSLSILGKLIGTLIPCMLCHVPFREAFTLGIILCTLGIFDVQSYTAAFKLKCMNGVAYTYMVMVAFCIAGITGPLVRFLYNPSRRYTVYKERTIQNTRSNTELRILVCVYNEDSVPTVINILEATNVTKGCPIAIYLLHLVELAGRGAPILISHKHSKNPSDVPTSSHPIINSFKIYEKRYPDAVSVQAFTAITPFVSAHEDICTIALERRTSFIIIPFHKRWNIDGTIQIFNWTTANNKVLKQAPCSVGILIDRGMLNQKQSILSSLSKYTVGVIFLGDADDREALYLAMRMSGQKNVHLVVHRMMLSDNRTFDVTQKTLDNNAIYHYRVTHTTNALNQYKEEIVKDVVEMINVFRSIEHAYDLILVGRSHKTYSRLLSGFTEWSEHPELGFFGDMLATSDFRGNVSALIIQRHFVKSTDVVVEGLDQEQYNGSSYHQH